MLTLTEPLLIVTVICVRGIASVTYQGPFGQANFHGGPDGPLEQGVAMKAPKEYPYMERYANIAGWMYMGILLEELYGLQVSWPGAQAASAQQDIIVQSTNPIVGLSVHVHNLRLHGQEYELETLL